MEYKLVITDFFEALENADEMVAKKLCGGVQHELKILDKISILNTSAKPLIKQIEQLQENVLNGRIHSARGKWRSIKAGFNGQLKDKLQEVLRERKHVELLSIKENRTKTAHGMSQNDDKTPVLSVGGRKKPAIQKDEVHGKRVSQARRQDDIHVADLSDVYRPTKIAERFSELFDNEWAEVFESLSKNKGDEQLKESEIISILLEIVEQAYQFCYVEAEDQITKIKLAVAGILKGDARPALQSARSNQNQRQRHLLLQYRKELAADASERLSKVIKDDHSLTGVLSRYIFRIFENNSLAIPSNGGPTATYSRKSVELTWLMCVEDPPIFMCPTRGKFNPSLYIPTQKQEPMQIFLFGQH